MAYKNKRCLWLVGKKNISASNNCDFLTPTDAVTENSHSNIWPVRNKTNPTG
jgi:hypothetical protein